ncbi:DinB family protein [Flavobacterium sp. CYK-55]|uniref:DinB family protein n=1 Tax=Flavobacterium sp. CYK-55 TaxID=2835529 RepID=UPI001BCE1E1F|nr:DinB family protein [Flavobacterium sp. CYK-55]MBS7787982.1 DinB family protein [Flavobacterium sp. CYK-55]
MKLENWFDRKFNFENPQCIFPAIIERLEGTSARLEEKLNNRTDRILKYKPNNTWSIQENLGHLIDLELLWQERLDDILNHKPEMRPADLRNQATHLANHNQRTIETLLSEFRALRKQTVSRLVLLRDDEVLKSALHPRLKTPMRTTDLFWFVAEHDDHHLACMTKLLQEAHQLFSADTFSTPKNQKRVKFDFEISFSNSGSLIGHDFRLDLHQEDISEDALASHLIHELRLLMVQNITISNKEIINEAHKRI